MEYDEFIRNKSQCGTGNGFEPESLPDGLFEFQEHLVQWALKLGRAALFADCGLGKTFMQLAWADQIVRHTNKPVLILTPLAVARQTQSEADKFGISAACSFDGKPATGKQITITNYQQLHKFDKNDFGGVVCDESSIIKRIGGATQKNITRFMNKMPYRLLCTATAAPNDWVELGTSSEALGELSNSEMLKRFFRQLDDKGQKKEQRQQDEATKLIQHDAQYYQKLSFRVAQTIGQWRLKHHAVEHFWRWVTSWARAVRKPSDLGFSDDGFELPPITYNDHVIESAGLQPGRLFNLPAFGLGEERDERKRTINERCEHVADLVSHDRPAVVWCQMNAEGDLLERIIPGARQIAGRTPDEEKIEIYEAFACGQLNKLVIKPKIGAWGLNWQHCNHVVQFASHSYEQTYQSVRRCWRFGQTRPVTVDTVATEGEVRVLENMRRKSTQADEMFERLVRMMNNSDRIERATNHQGKVEVPQWLK
jgi:hypothetical protein